MAELSQLQEAVQQRFAEHVVETKIKFNELTVEVKPESIRSVCLGLRDEAPFHFDQLIDVCGLDYLKYGVAEWVTEDATSTGFERAANRDEGIRVIDFDKPRFASVYHLLSTTENHRIRIKAFLQDDCPMIESVVDIWAAADWFEREAFDLVGILYEGHPDLRRILTDYGFVGHPFRKDFPLIGQVEMRYDATEKRVVYEPVSIKPRILVPKVIRKDSRYLHEDSAQEVNDG